MVTKALIILTHEFPFKRGESWLAEEVKYIGGNWESVNVFCECNQTETTHPGYPQFNLLTDTFTYKRKWTAFINIRFLSALLKECIALFHKGKLLVAFRYSVSLFLRAYSEAHWFNENYLEKDKDYLLYCYWGDELTTMACLLKTLNKRVSIVCRVHGVDAFEEQTKFKHIQFRHFQLKQLSRMFSISQAGSDHIKTAYPAFAGKIETTYLGTAGNGLNPLPGNQRLELLSCAIVRNVKRLELIVEVLKHVKSPLRWTLAGNGPDFKKLQELCKSLPPHITVDLLGYQTSKDIENLYKTRPLHYYISVSSSEGLPVAMMESISYGVPVISTNVGGCKEIVNSTTGVLINVDFNPIELAKQVDELYLKYDYNSEQRKRIHDEWDKKFNAARNYKAFYKELSEINE